MPEIILPVTVDTDQAINMLEDYGYSYNFSRTVLFSANMVGSWTNTRGTITLKPTRTGMWEFTKYQL